jgi:hypothetical protein
MNTKTFLEKIFNNEKINFRALKDNEKPINVNGYFDENMKDKLKQLNEQGYNIYFTVNSGGTKKEQINKINAFQIDCDCGKDDKGNYFNLDIVNQYKQNVLKRVQEFELVPSFIVDTRNGYHIYWLVDNAKVEQFEEVQKKLIHYFNSDERVYTPERIMRVPNFYWTKDINNQYLCTIYQYNDVRYNANDFIQHLNSKVPDFVPEKKNISTKTKVSKQFSIDNTNEHIDAIRRLDVAKMKELLCNKFDKKLPSNADISRVRGMGGKTENNNKDNIYLTYCSPFYPTPFKASNRADLKHIIYTKLCINDFLGVPEGMFNCVLHNDSNPSAHILVLEDGTQLYKCFGCGFVGTITTLVEAIARCNKVEAVEFIQKVYDIELVETENQKRIKEMLKENIEYIMSSQFEQEYPEIYKIINRYIPELVCLHEIAIQNVTDDDLIQDNQAIFFTSIRYIANYLKYSNLKRISDRVNLFTFLGMIEKLSKENIPEKYLQKAEEYKKDKYITSYYSIPSYCFDKMQNINTKAKLYKEKNMTMTGFSREMLIRSLNQNEANKVYVQQKDEKLSEASQKFADKAIKIILQLIQAQGYCTEEQIIRQIRGKKEEKKIKLKRCLQEILESYNLKRVKANKELKQKFGIASKGYPFLILKETEETL